MIAKVNSYDAVLTACTWVTERRRGGAAVGGGGSPWGAAAAAV